MLVQGQVQNADYVVALHQAPGQHIQNVKTKVAFINPLIIIMMPNLQLQLSKSDMKIGLYQDMWHVIKSCKSFIIDAGLITLPIKLSDWESFVQFVAFVFYEDLYI